MFHFINANMQLGYGDNRKIIVGETLTVDCEPVLCKSGLHASERALDALYYANSSIVTIVELGGKIVHGEDKSVGTERTVLAIADIEEELKLFARQCALDVIHLWNPEQIVIDYLHTGDESLRASAWASASASPWASARDSALASASARDSARDSTWASASASAWDSARDSAWASAWASARASAWANHRKMQNNRLEDLIFYARDYNG